MSARCTQPSRVAQYARLYSARSVHGEIFLAFCLRVQEAQYNPGLMMEQKCCSSGKHLPAYVHLGCPRRVTEDRVVFVNGWSSLELLATRSTAFCSRKVFLLS